MKSPIHTVRTDHFTGPVKLLVYLIQQHKLTTATIDLKMIVDQYADYIHDCLKTDTQLSSFTDELPLFGWLIEHRSCDLLPVTPPPPAAISEDYETKIKQILEYRRFQTLAQALRQAHSDGQKLISSLHPLSIQNHDQPIQFEKEWLVFDDDQFLQAWQDIQEKLRYAQVKDHNIIKVRWSPAELKAKIIQFLQDNKHQKWELLTFLLNFAFDLTSLLCAFLVTLEVIYHDQLHLVKIDQEWWVSKQSLS